MIFFYKFLHGGCKLQSFKWKRWFLFFSLTILQQNHVCHLQTEVFWKQFHSAHSTVFLIVETVSLLRAYLVEQYTIYFYLKDVLIFSCAVLNCDWSDLLLKIGS